MDPRLAELLARFLGEGEVLTYEELHDELLPRLIAHFDELQESGAAVADLRVVAENVAAVRDVIRQADEAAVAEAAELAELANLVHAEPEPAAETQPAEGEELPGDDGETAAPEEGGEETEPEASVEEMREPEPVTAAAATPPPPRAPIRAVARRLAVQPTTLPTAPEPDPVTIVAAGDLPGTSAGSHISDLATLGRLVSDKIDTVRRGSPGRYHLATFQSHALEGETDGQVSETRTTENSRIVQEAVRRHYDAMHQSMVASGGFCAPAQPLYTFQEIHTVDRPIFDALTRIPSPRGRLTFLPPANLADADSGIVVWTAENDEALNNPATKPCVTITCPSETTVNVDAIPLCIEVGNFDRITFPEHFAHFFSVAMGQHARVSERNLIDQIDASSTAVTDGQNLGAARDILEALGRHAAARRDRFRMSPTAPVVVMLRSWVRDMIRADLVRESPGSSDERLATADAKIDTFFASHNLAPVWTLEGRTGAGQDFAAQVAGPAQTWPGTVEVHMFHPSAFFLMTLPELNLGTEIRDSTLNATNDVQAWLETFEGVGMNGYWASRIRITVCVTGEAAALVDVACTGS